MARRSLDLDTNLWASIPSEVVSPQASAPGSATATSSRYGNIEPEHSAVLERIYFDPEDRVRFRANVCCGTQFPAGCGILILHDFNGIEGKHLAAIEAWAQTKRYGTLVATTARQVHTESMLEAAGWQRSYKFCSPNTGNWCTQWHRLIPKRA